MQEFTILRLSHFVTALPKQGPYRVQVTGIAEVLEPVSSLIHRQVHAHLQMEVWVFGSP